MCDCISVYACMWPCVVCVCVWGSLLLFTSSKRDPLCGAGMDPLPDVFVSQEIVFYKVIDYILHGKEDIKVIP